MLASVTVAAISLALAPDDASGFDYVRNGSFEDGTASWAAVGGVIEAVGADAVAPADGTRSGRATLGSALMTLRQGVYSAVPPGPYRLSLMARGAARATLVTARLSTTDAAVNSAQVPVDATPGAWTAGYVDITLTTFADVSVSIMIDGAPGDVTYVDAVRLDGAAPGSVPTPTVTPDTTVTTTVSATVAATVTKTPTPTRTATVTRTATATPDTYVGAFRNGGFEQTTGAGAIVGWERYGGTLSAATSPVHSGNLAARFESTSDSTKWLYQTVAVEPGATYAFDAWVLDDDANVASTFLRVSWYASDDGGGPALGSADSGGRLDAPSAGFRHLTTGSASAPAGAHTARLRVMLAPASAGRAAIYVDDASFGPVSAGDPTMAAAPPGAGTGSAQTITVRDATRARRGGATASANARASARVSGARVVINEVLYDPDTSPDAAGEWVELYNAGDADQDVTGWTLSDNGGTDQIAPLVVPARGYAIVAASDSFPQAHPEYRGALAAAGGRIGNSLGNDGDHLLLKDGGGALVDAVSWGNDTSVLKPAVADVPAGHSIERRTPGADTDKAADFVDNHRPSPGAPFEAAPAKPQPQTTAGRPIDAGPPPNNALSAILPWASAASAVTLALAVAAWRVAPFVRRRFGR